jgi:hypothetical protein
VSAVPASAQVGELTYHQPIVLPSINLNHLKISNLPDLLFTIIGRLLCANPVACENALAGTPPSDWSIREPGDTSILGFATEQSVNVGETVIFKIKTPATSYHIDILRAGWYQGNGARKVVSGLRPSVQLPQTQPACLVDETNTSGLIDCGNWSPSASWTVPRDAVSGLYFARLVRDDTGGSSYVLFVVRNDASHADIVYQTSDTTRAAYNAYGGNSLYSCTVHCPPGNPLIYKSAYKISFNRPNIAVEIGMQYSFFGGELQLVQFLEANGYDMSYISGVDADRNGALISNHRVFISSGHDEYWSGAQRANVERARDGGVNLAFFSGNEVYWKTRYENSIDGSNTSHRTLVTYKETHFNQAVDPLDPSQWTGTWRDPRFSPPGDGGRPENALTGTMYSVDPPASFPIEITAADGKMRFWRNTSVAAQAANETATLAPNTLGYEWNTDYDNDARPAGIMHLSTTTRSVNSLLVDAGNTYTHGVATHHMTLHRAASGALVFSAGTIQWSWGLEGSPDGTTAPDNRMQQATVNLLADMGVQPTALLQTLRPASVSSDHTPPVSTITTPAPGTTVQSNAMVTILGTASDRGGVVGGVEVSTDGGATWHAASGRENWIYQWTPAMAGTATILSRAVDDSGNLEKSSMSVSAAVAPRTCPCSIWPLTAAPSVSAATDDQPIEVGVKFFSEVDGWITGVRFFKGASSTGTQVASLWTTNGALLARASYNKETASGWQQVDFSAPVAINAGTHYVVSYHTSTGHYAADHDYFAVSSHDNSPLHALKTGTDGGNGVYAYSKDSTFPTSTFQSSNYWVDVVFSPKAATAAK